MIWRVISFDGMGVILPLSIRPFCYDGFAGEILLRFLAFTQIIIHFRFKTVKTVVIVKCVY